MFSAKAKLGLGIVRSSAWVAAVFVFALNGQESGPARLSLAFSFGGSQTDRIFAIGTDAAQNIYVAGDTNSRDLPGAAAYSSSSTVAFVAKFDPSAAHLLYTVILGGSNGDSARGIAVDSSGNAYVTGFTASSNFPVTTGALQSQIGSIGFQDAFVAKLSPTGALIYSTYLGGSSTDTGTAIAVDQTGAAYVTGLTNSVNFPVTSGAPQGSFGGGGSDCFVAKLNSAGSALSYSTYLGGNNLDECTGIAIDATEAAFVTGTTSSGNFPVAAALQPTQGSSFSPDAFLTKLSPAGTSLLFSTYLGGEGVDNGNAVQLDQTGNAYVGGSTNSILFPVTSGALQTQLLGTFNGFWCEVASDGSGILYATYLGGSGTDAITSLYVASDGRIVGAGFTTSVDFPTVSPIQQSFGGDFDGFVAVLSLNGTSLDFASYLGGAGDDKAYAITPGSSDTFVVAGQVMSQSVSYMPPRFSSPPPNQTDGFVAAIVYPGPPILPALVSFNPVSGSGLSQAFTAVYSSSAGGGDIFATQVLINNSFSNPLSCYFGYQSGNQFLLLNDAGTAWLPTTISGGSGSLSNSQCTILGSGSSASISGNQLTVTYNIQFHAGFAGQKTIWTNAYSSASGLGSAWQSNTGGATLSWTVPSSTPRVPTLVSFTPASGSGLSQAFTAVYSSVAGGSDIFATQVLINSSFSNPRSCYFGYQSGNQFLLLNDAGTAWLPTTITGGSGSLSNGQCTILGSGSSASISGNQLTVTYNIQFQAGFAGPKTIWTNAYSSASGLGSAWQSNTGGANFAWSVPSMTPILPTLVSFVPASGSGLTQEFTAVYSSVAGGGDIFATQVLINSSFSSPQSCYFGYQSGNQFLLLNDAGTGWLPTAITGGSGSLSNSQCAILGFGSTASISGNQLTVTYNIQFQAGFAGQKTVWTNAYSAASGLGSAWQSNTGGATLSWTVPSSTPTVPTLVSFTPASGSGLSQAFTAVYSSVAGGGDIFATQVLINSSFSNPQSCYFGYQSGNQFLLLNDAGTGWLPTTISGGSGSLSNSQCTILGSGSSTSISGNQLTVIYNIQFQAGFIGQKTIWTNAYSSASGLGSAWQSNTGGANFAWTVPSMTPTVPTLVSFTPASGSGLSQAFTAVYSSVAGGADIFATQVLINSSFSNPRSCYFGYQSGNQFLLLNDAGTAWLPTAITGGSGSLSNSQCTILGSGSTASISGNQLTVTYNIQFQAVFAGQKTIWSNAYSSASGLGSAWQSNTGGATLSWTPP